jgi:hypothetical protein
VSLAESRDEFRLIDDDDASEGSEGDEFFARESASAAFYHIELGIDLVRAIDANIYSLDLVEIGYGNAQVSGEAFGIERSGDASDAESLLDSSPDGFDSEPGCRTCSETDYVAVFDELDSALGGAFFGFIAHE